MAWSQFSWPTWSSSPKPEVPGSQNSDAASQPKPCCVCKDEKSRRDECMLVSQAADPAEDCKSMVDKYKACMAGYGFKI